MCCTVQHFTHTVLSMVLKSVQRVLKCYSKAANTDILKGKIQYIYSTLIFFYFLKTKFALYVYDFCIIESIKKKKKMTNITFPTKKLNATGKCLSRKQHIT